MDWIRLDVAGWAILDLIELNETKLNGIGLDWTGLELIGVDLT